MNEVECLYSLKMKIPKPTKEDREVFSSLAPEDSRVSTRLVFGNDAAFVNGNMFFGIYGSDIFVRLPEKNAIDLLKEKGSRPFEPMPGHAMKGYYVLPRNWRSKSTELRRWIAISLEWTSTMPMKKTKR